MFLNFLESIKIMKIYNKIGFVALTLAFMTSCAVHDPFTDNLEIGQTVPTVSWEIGSTVAKAGSYVSFKGKYYTSADRTIDHSEVWGMVTRSTSAAATCRRTTSLSYTKTITPNDTVRNATMLQTYPHAKATWDGWEYVLADSFQVSQTLSPVSWSEPAAFDQEKFDLYYPSTFQSEFMTTVINYLTKDSTYYNDLRNIYINYEFTKEQFEALNTKYGFNMPTVTDAGEKSDAWSVTDVVDHYYYITIDSVNGKAVKTEHEITNKTDAPAGVKVYDVYKSAEWVFCRYSDDTGGKITSVRAKYMPYWKELISEIPFKDWIYNTTDKNYSVSFNRKYTIIPTFRVYDTEGKMGTDSEAKSIELN
jgi:hypothetical protein